MQIFENNPEYQVTATSVTQDYNILGAVGLSWDAVKAALLAYAPQSNAPAGATYQWPMRSLNLKEIDGTSGQWTASITWASLSYQYALKIGGQQQQIRCDLSVVNAYPNSALGAAGQVPAMFAAGTNGAAVWFDGKSVHGASIYVPQRTWTESVEIPLAQYTFSYEDDVFSVQQSPVNSAPFRGYDPGEVLFLGMNAQLSTQNPNFVTASYEFSMSPNNSSDNGNLLTIGGIANIAKDGWDYLDVKYQQVVDSTAPTLIPQPQYIVIHRLYKR